jgi:hypothetical protein
VVARLQIRMRALLLAASVLACGPQLRVHVDAEPITVEGSSPDAPPAPADAPAEPASALDRTPAADAAPEPDAAADATADSAPPVCAFAFCEDFEGVAAGSPPDPKVWSRTGNILVETAPGGRAGQAMHVRAGQTPTETYVSQTRTLPALGEAFFARVRMYIAARPTDFFHWSFTEARGKDVRGTVVRYGGISVGCQPGMFCRDSFFFQIKPLVYGPDEGGSASDDLTPVIPEKKWLCLEWYLNSKTMEARLWWDGEERPKAHYLADKPIPFPGFDRFYLGWALYQTGTAGPWEVWFDDLAIDGKRVGCAP